MCQLYSNLVAGNSACLTVSLLCDVGDAASTVNVDRVSLNNGGNLLLVYFLLMASKVHELGILLFVV
jgi:hypothetical protein